MGESTFDNTFASSVTLDATGAASKTDVPYDVGANGKAMILTGRGTQYLLALGVHADDLKGSGVFLNPLGITNASRVRTHHQLGSARRDRQLVRNWAGWTDPKRLNSTSSNNSRRGSSNCEW